MDTSDIKKRIAADFGKDAIKASEILKTAISKNKSLNHERIIRAIIYLSQGDIKELTNQLNNAITDYRDVLFAAEYDHSENEPKQVRDFNIPFEVL